MAWVIGGASAALSWLVLSANWAAIGYGLAVASLYKIIVAQDRPFQFRWLIILIAALQNVIAPHLYYLGAYESDRYRMYVTEDTYIPIAVLSIAALAFGLLIFGSRKEADQQIAAANRIPKLVARAPFLPFLLVSLSIAGTALASSSVQLGFVGVLLSNLKYSAALLLLFSARSDRFVWVGIILSLAALEALATSLFHDAILWSIFAGGAITYLVRFRVSTKLAAAAVALAALTVIQTVKNDYRDITWRGGDTEASQLYFDLALDKTRDLFSGQVPLNDVLSDIVTRLNQGWVVSRVIAVVPSAEPYAKGETIRDAVIASLVPRVLMPNKPVTGGQENFKRFTQLSIGPNTSIAIGLLGESYANFGPLWSAVFLFTYGLGVTSVISAFLALSRHIPIVVAFLPNMLLHTIKSETEFLSVMNFLIKGAVFHAALGVIIMMFLVRRRSTRPAARARPTKEPPA